MTTEANGLPWCGECISAHEHPNDPSSRCYTCKRRSGFVKAETHAEGSVNPQKRIADLESQLAECENALISMVQQFFYSKDDENIFRHSFMSAEEEAAEYLVEHGIARWVGKNKSAICFNEVQE